MTERTLAKRVLLTAKTVQTGLAYAPHAIQPSLRRRLVIRADVQQGTLQRHKMFATSVGRTVQHALTFLVNARNVQIHLSQSLLAAAFAPHLNILLPQTFVKHVLRTVLCARI